MAAVDRRVSTKVTTFGALTQKLPTGITELTQALDRKDDSMILTVKLSNGEILHVTDLDSQNLFNVVAEKGFPRVDVRSMR